MSDIPKDLLYTEDHEYLKPTDDADVVAIGITDYAQGELGDVVFIELPKVGASFSKHDVFGTVEAVKAVSELYSPVSGEIVAVNDRLDKEPALVNSSPYGANSCSTRAPTPPTSAASERCRQLPPQLLHRRGAEDAENGREAKLVPRRAGCFVESRSGSLIVAT